MPDYVLVTTEAEYQAASELFREYARHIDVDLGFQQFDHELKTLPGIYGAPQGGIILCRENGKYLGCVAIRRQEEGIAELKRMFVKPDAQGRGIGRELMQRSIRLASELGYRKIRLDTLNSMHTAIHLYTAYGFAEIPAYYYNPIDTAVYFEKTL